MLYPTKQNKGSLSMWHVTRDKGTRAHVTREQPMDTGPYRDGEGLKTD